MKKFITQFTSFLIITSVILIAMVGGTIYIMSQASFKIDKQKNILILGDSHTATGIDDNIFKKSVNLSQNANAYMYSYCTLKKVIDNNQQIDAVLLSFHYDVLTQEKENTFIMQEDFLVSKVVNYITLLGKNEFFIYNNKGSLLQAILKIPIRNISLILKYFHKGKSNFSYKDLRIGGYLKLDRQELKRDIEKQNELPTQTNTGLSVIQKEYLLKIVYFCKKHDVKLILINMPTYKPDIYGNLEKLREYHQKYLKDVEFLDYSSFSFPDESYYGDVGHLNHKGAEIFSVKLAHDIDSLGILKCPKWQ